MKDLKDNRGMTRLPSGLSISGELTSSEDITVMGRFEGQLIVDSNHVEIGASAVVRAKVVARAVTICGTLDGNVIATDNYYTYASSVRKISPSAKVTTIAGSFVVTGYQHYAAHAMENRHA